MDNKQVNYEVTAEALSEVIVQEQYAGMGYRTAICTLVLHDGREVVGSFSTVAPGALTFSKMKEKAREAALMKVREYVTTINTNRYTFDQNTAAAAAEKLKNTDNESPDEPPKGDDN